MIRHAANFTLSKFYRILNLPSLTILAWARTLIKNSWIKRSLTSTPSQGYKYNSMNKNHMNSLLIIISKASHKSQTFQIIKIFLGPSTTSTRKVWIVTNSQTVELYTTPIKPSQARRITVYNANVIVFPKNSLCPCFKILQKS